MIIKINAKALYNICKEQNFIDSDITYQEFYYVTRDFNNAISLEILEGYKFNTVIGSFEIVKKERRRRSIDWGSSNKKKQALIDAGKVPYNKERFPEGENWFVYYIDQIKYNWQWLKGSTVKGYCYFIASIDNKRNLGRTVNRKKETQTENYVSLT